MLIVSVALIELKSYPAAPPRTVSVRLPICVAMCVNVGVCARTCV